MLASANNAPKAEAEEDNEVDDGNRKKRNQCSIYMITFSLSEYSFLLCVVSLLTSHRTTHIFEIRYIILTTTLAC